jgi:hypothetical protein
MTRGHDEDPGGSLKPVPAPHQFHSRPTFEQAQALISAGTTMTSGHDVDTLDRARNT